MILAGDFYKVPGVVNGEDNIDAILEINPEHAIFRGHFPGQPVVPGVCMMQIVKELVETATGRALRLVNGNDVKFLSVIDPRRNSIINAHIIYSSHSAGSINATARLFHNETTFFKFKGIFKEV